MEDHRMEDHRIGHRTDRLGVLLDQLDFVRQMAQARLGGMASPASLPKGAPLPPRTGDGPIRRRGEAVSPRPFGPGEWQIDGAIGDPDPTPVTTIAWRLGHLHLDVAGSWEWTFGGRRRPPDQLVDFSPSAAVALERFWATVDRWRDSVAAVTGEQLDTVGYCQYPWSDAAELPFISVIWASNIEFIHHMAEIALLRDLYRTR
jgi:DinB superfamily